VVEPSFPRAFSHGTTRIVQKKKEARHVAPLYAAAAREVESPFLKGSKAWVAPKVW